MDEGDGVGDAGVEGVGLEGGIGELEWEWALEGVGCAHGKFDVPVGEEVSMECSGGGLEGEGGRGWGEEGGGEFGEAACAVAAHFCFGAIAVEVAHFEVGGGGVGGKDCEESICADAVGAVTEKCDEFGGEGEWGGAEVKDNEVVAGAGHFVEGEEERHGESELGWGWNGIDLGGEVEVELGDAAGGVGGELEGDFVPADGDVWVVVCLFSEVGDLVYELDGLGEVAEGEGAVEVWGGGLLGLPAWEVGKVGLDGVPLEGLGFHGD